MSQAPTPSETPITDALEEAGLLTVKFTRRLERDRARLMEALSNVMNDERIQGEFKYLDKGIGTKTISGQAFLTASELLKELS